MLKKSSEIGVGSRKSHLNPLHVQLLFVSHCSHVETYMYYTYYNYRQMFSFLCLSDLDEVYDSEKGISYKEMIERDERRFKVTDMCLFLAQM